MNFDRAAVHLDDTLGDRESEPAAALLARAAVVDLLELFKYFALILGRAPASRLVPATASVM